MKYNVCSQIAISLAVTVIPSVLGGSLPSAATSGVGSQGEATPIDYKARPFVVTEEYPFGNLGVHVQHRSMHNTTALVKPKLLDISPAKCEAQCYPGSFQPPKANHCDTIITSLLANSTGSLQASPNTWVYMYFKTCVVVFQNPDLDSCKLEYNWSILGANAKSLKHNCLDTPALRSTGGACIFGSYLSYDFPNVEVSLQRFDDFSENNKGPGSPSDPGNTDENSNENGSSNSTTNATDDENSTQSGFSGP
ncbi:hypothetical protein CROQUDRAFT_671584 [Cronartium quercuum f. sp. fusiforme G11]|uniref:Uncharacterized protein n=1 Tax=Cronartium quercuum f. sp. fusiforme G11 TaxID=708437 RepID=A0A9P6NKF3_9BASI|nr:hypothetical protein CROQUDRAFT_671584 [Cronartium quercuum f. sp. fusiforme G11]